MTIIKIANQADEQRGKIGPWDRSELVELVAAMREAEKMAEQLLVLGVLGKTTSDDADNVRRALFDLTKALASTVVAGAPELAGELARDFLVIWGGTKSEEQTARVQWEPVRVSVLSTETRVHEATGHLVDVSLLRISYFDALNVEHPAMVDALLVRRDRINDDRRVRHFPQEVNSQHFDRAVECRAQWLGVSDGPFAGLRPCT